MSFAHDLIKVSWMEVCDVMAVCFGSDLSTSHLFIPLILLVRCAFRGLETMEALGWSL